VSKPYTAPPSQIWGWGVGRIAEFALIATFGQAMTIFTIGFGLNPAIVGTCTALPRLVDGVIDPIIGHWSDNTHTRWGRRKPFMIGGAFVGAFFLSILWWASPTWSPTTQFIYLGVIGLLTYLCYGAYAMAWNAVGYELSDDYHERSRISAIGGFFLAAAALGNSWIYWLALRPVFGGVVWGMRWIGLGVSLLIIVSAVATTMTTRERFTKSNRAHVKLWPAIRTAIRNRPFVILLLMKVTEIFGGRLVGGMSIYLGVYYTCRGDQDLASKIAGVSAVLGTVWNFAVLPFVKPASQWIGKRGALILGAALAFVSSLVTPFITLPEHPWWGLIPGLVITPLLVISGTVALAILPDICDVDELETGQRREGLFTSVQGFVAKLEISLAVALTGYLMVAASIDTTIGRRWDQLIDGKADAVPGFVAGEMGVYQFADAKPATFDRLTIDGGIEEVELSVSDESPTQGFRTVGMFRDGSQSMHHAFTFAPATGKYVRVKLIAGPGASKQITLDELELTSTQGIPPTGAAPIGLLSAGSKQVAAQPPQRVVNRLFWIVMVPGIVFSGLTLLTTIMFPLTEEKMLEVRRRLDEIRLANAAAGVPTDEVADEIVHQHPEVAAELRHQHPKRLDQDRP